MSYKAVGFDFNGVLSDGHCIDEMVVEIVKNLRAKGIKTGIISNYGSGGAEIIRSSGISDHFDVIHVSGETGFAKPLLEAFTVFAEELGVKTNELIFIDDSEYCLSTAPQSGFMPIHFTNASQLDRALKKAGLDL